MSTTQENPFAGIVDANGEPIPDIAEGEVAPSETIDESRERMQRADRARRGELFNPAEFDDPRLKLTTEDGERIDEIVVRLTGSIVLDRKNPNHVELFRELRSGRPCIVEAACHITQETLDAKTKGDDTILSAARKLAVWRIESVRIAGRTISLPGRA